MKSQTTKVEFLTDLDENYRLQTMVYYYTR